MFNARSVAIGSCLLAIVLSTPGCLWHRTKIVRGGGTAPKGVNVALMSATNDQLVQRLHKIYDSTLTFSATVDMTPATGSVYKGEITEYKDIRAYVLYRAPRDIRVIGLAPVVRTKVFDMVSSGQGFHILIPPKNRFVEGRNDTPAVSKNSIENLRPDAFLEAMLIRPPEPQETPLLVDATDEQNAQYVMVLITKDPAGKLTVTRTIFFDRTNLSISRQRKYDASGTIVSDTKYQTWKNFRGGVPFPTFIDITRPKDGYGVTMNLVKLDMNTGISDEKFVLAKPEGVQMQVIGAAALRPGQTQ